MSDPLGSDGGPLRGQRTPVDEVVVMDCDRPHTYEVIGSVKIEAEDFPGARAIERRSDACLARFNDYLDIACADSRHELNHYSPTRESWLHDEDRTITCLGLHPQEKKLRRSLEGIAR